VLNDKEKKKEMIEKSGQMGVPVTEIDGRIIVGCRLDKIKRALKIR
jgi:glutaredoxin